MFCYYCGTEFEGDVCPKCNRNQSKLEGGDGFFDIVKKLNFENASSQNVSTEPPKANPVEKGDSHLKKLIDALQRREAECERECEEIKGKYSELKAKIKKYWIVAIVFAVILVVIDIAGFVCMARSLKSLEEKTNGRITQIEEKTSEIEEKFVLYVNTSDFEGAISEQNESVNKTVQGIEEVEKKISTLESDIKDITDLIEELKAETKEEE